MAHGSTMESEFLEGRHALAEALDAGVPVQTIYASDAAFKDKRISKLLGRAQADGIRIERASVKELDSRSAHGAHQGIVAKLEPYEYASLRQLVDNAQGCDDALVIACDHITDAGNFGAIIRTADVVGAAGVLIPNRRCVRVTTATYKTSAGAVAYVPIAQEANLVKSLEKFKEEGFWIIGASEHATMPPWDVPLSGRIVLVMGSEDAGLARLTRETCDMLVSLPQKGHVESLNVAQATTAIAYEWVRQCSVARS